MIETAKSFLGFRFEVPHIRIGRRRGHEARTHGKRALTIAEFEKQICRLSQFSDAILAFRCKSDEHIRGQPVFAQSDQFSLQREYRPLIAMFPLQFSERIGDLGIQFDIDRQRRDPETFVKSGVGLTVT
ncbi:MAG: hypothetical protein P4L76_02520 [Beijerinckiaceae bacterium]|nr:hypothetical protein [Beijerinckiaceae bacterium]